MKKLLDSLKHLTYKNFEVIVVNGPSSDNTASILAQYEHLIKVENCPIANLSVSRNIGIQASAGEIVAFIDDDAIPTATWLDELLSLYSDDTVGGVGGKVIDGADFTTIQNQNVVIDMYGVPLGSFDYPQDYNDSNGEYFNIMIGCNCSFRRTALIEVDGFDEYYEYFHDESDLAVRIIKKGYKILHHPNAAIHHAYAASDLRGENRVLKNWYPIIKNSTYFALKNADFNGITEKEKRDLIKEKLKVYKNNALAGLDLFSKEYRERLREYKNAFSRGYADGEQAARLTNSNLDNTKPFLKFNTKLLPDYLNIVLLCRYGIDSRLGGVAKYTMELAEELTRMGHNVHIITQGDSNSYLRDGINYHFTSGVSLDNVDEALSKTNITKGNLEYSYGVFKKINLTNNVYKFDIIESALWDYEGLVSNKLGAIPVTVRVETPSLMVADTQKWILNEDLNLNAEMEAVFIQESSGIIYISNAIKETIENLYQLTFDKSKSHLCYLGITDEIFNGANIDKVSNNITVFFIGRLERRKGMENLFDAIENIAEKYSNVEFRIAGKDDIVDNQLGDTFKNHFLKKYQNYDWINKVEFLGEISEVQKECEFNSCDIFVSPSLYESFGIIFLEAMRFQKPVIGCNVGGMTEVIDDGVSGILVPPNNSDELTNALMKLIEDSNLRIKLGMNGRKRYEELFTANICSQNSVRIYKEIISKHK